MAQQSAQVLRSPVAERKPAASVVQRSLAVVPPQTARSATAAGIRGPTTLASVAVSAPVSVQCARISHPSDPAEVEARQTARKVVQMAQPATTPAGKPREERKVLPMVQRAQAAASPPVKQEEEKKKVAPVVQRSEVAPAKSTKPQQKKEKGSSAPQGAEGLSTPSVKADKPTLIVQRAESASTPAPKPAATASISTIGGSPLPAPVRTFMEPRFGANFGNVRIHTGESAAQQSHMLNAEAFTVGEHVFFGRHQFNPNTSAGRELIAHELTHTIQQGAAIQRSVAPPVGQVRVNPTSPGSVQREEKSTLDAALGWLGEQASSLVDFGAAAGWALLERVAPDLVPIVRGGPRAIIDWLRVKAEAAAEWALNAIAAPVRAAGGAGAQLNARFAPLVTAIQQAAAQVAQNDCTPLRLAAQKIEATAIAIVLPIVEFLQPIVTKVKSFLDDVWQLIGAPIWEWIKQRAAEHWAAIQWLWGLIKKVAGWIWDNTAALRELASKAWTWFKNTLGIGEGPEGENGLLQWVQGKVEAAWEGVKVKLGPYRQQIMTVAATAAAVLLMFSPAGPILAVGAAVAGAVQGLRWIHANWGKGDAIVRARQYLEKTLIPTLTSALDKVMAAVSRAAGAIAGFLGSIAASMANAAAAIQNSVLKLAAGVVQWLANQAQALSAWAAGGLAPVTAFLKSALAKLTAFLKRMLDFLSAVGRAVLDVWKVPALIMGGIWKAIPPCIRDPVVDFLVPLIIGQIELFQDLVNNDEAWKKTKKDVLNIIKLVFTDGDLKGALLAIFDLILRVFNIEKDLLVQIKAKALAAWDTVVKKPLAFIKNLVRSIAAGFRMLKDNIRSHLEFGLKEWLLGPLKEEGITPPKNWTDIRQVFEFALQVMGINKAHIFKLIGDRIGTEKANALRDWVNRIAGVVALVSELIDVNKTPDENTRGIVARAGDFAATIFKGLAEWVAGRVAAELAQMAAAAAASAGLSEVLDIARRIYRALLTAKRYAGRVLGMVNKSLDNILAIAKGDVEAVGAKIEQILHDGMPVVIGFLADQVGLGGVTQAIRDAIKGLRAKVDEALRWVIDKVASALEAIAGAVKAGIAALRDWWTKKVPIGDKAEPHTLQFDGSEENSRLMVHSSAQTVPDFLSRFEKVEGAEKDVGAARALSKKIDDLLAKYRLAAPKKKKDKNAGDELAQEISSTTDSLGTVLISLLARDKPVDLPPGEPVYTEGELPGCSDKVGIGMTIDGLGPDQPLGTKPQSGQQKNLTELLETDPSEASPDKFVRGHLLNEKLGGPGIAKNMFPITGKANSQHRVSTEDKIKGWLSKQPKKSDSTKIKKQDVRRVHYEVNVHVVSSDLKSKNNVTLNYVNASFVCRAILKDTSGKVHDQFSSSVPSTYKVRTQAVKEDDVVGGKKVK